MKYNRLGKTNFNVSELSFGASALGGVFSAIDEEEGIRTVTEVLKAGINYIDVAPAYGATKSESILGKALQGVDRKSYHLSTKSGKYTLDGVYGHDDFDYSEKRIRNELDLSLERLGTDYLDIVHLHDFDYHQGVHVESAFDSGFKTLLKLKNEGIIRAIGAGIYNLQLWNRVIAEAPVDVILLHNHYNLIDTTALNFLQPCLEKDIGIINASPFASGLLTPGPIPHWHPANEDERNMFKSVLQYSEENGFSLAECAFQFSTQQSYFPTTLFSTSKVTSLKRNLRCWKQPMNAHHIFSVQKVLMPLMNKQWNYSVPLGVKN